MHYLAYIYIYILPPAGSVTAAIYAGTHLIALPGSVTVAGGLTAAGGGAAP